MSRRRAAALTALDPARHVHRHTILNGGARFRRELWAATSADVDHTWTYTRQEDTGSTWTVTHNPTGRSDEHYPSLRSARAATADGSVLHRLDHPAPPTPDHGGCTYRSQFTGHRTGCMHTPDDTGLCAMHRAELAATA